MAGAPTIGVSGLTSTEAVTAQPAGVVYVMTAAPTATPVTMPVAAVTVAMPGFPLVHVPPDTALPSVVVPPKHTVVLPVIAETGLTVNIAEALQPPP